MPGCSDDKKAVNEACGANGECASGKCHRDVCVAETVWPNGTACIGPGQCRSSFCEEGVCAQGGGAEGTLCIYDEECGGNNCTGGRCGEIPDGGLDAGDGGPDGGDGAADDALTDALPDVGCEESKDCDDKLSCTDDLCGDAGSCTFEVQPTFCAIDGVCYSPNDQPEDNLCAVCDPDKDQKAWTAKDGTCDDEQDCTHDDQCKDGKCQGTPYSCDDGLTCTQDTCNAKGPPKATGCEYEIVTDTCLVDGIFCYKDGETDPGNQCRHCDPQKSNTTWTVAPLTGCVTTVSPAGSLVDPQGVDAEANGDAYVADAGSHQIKFYSKEQVTVLAGDGTAGDVDGPLASARFNMPMDVAVDATGKVYIADSENHKIRVIAGGAVSTLGGTGSAGNADGIVGNAAFNRPVAVTLDSSGKLLYVVDGGSHRIRKIDLNSASVTTLAGSSAGYGDGTGAAAKFNGPADVAVAPNGDVYVADSLNHRVRKIVSTTGVVTTVAGNGTAGYVDGIAGSGSVQLNAPTSIAVDSSSNIFIADSLNHRIRRINAAPPVVVSVAGDGTAGTGDGIAGAARLNTPRRVQIQGPWMFVISPPSKTLRIFIP